MAADTFHMDDLGDIEVVGYIDAGAPCPACDTSEKTLGWRFRTSRRGWEVYGCPGCRQNVAVKA